MLPIYSFVHFYTIHVVFSCWLEHIWHRTLPKNYLKQSSMWDFVQSKQKRQNGLCRSAFEKTRDCETNMRTGLEMTEGTDCFASLAMTAYWLHRKLVIPRSEATWESVLWMLPFYELYLKIGALRKRIATASVHTGFAMTKFLLFVVILPVDGGRNTLKSFK